tara:strand:- start:502 stop:693 length:192 start_codon:yes stop_codon:yes gene_type:complete
MTDKEVKNILKNETKDNKIGFILSCRQDKRLKTNDAYYQYVLNEYKLMDIDEIDNQFTFYINN